MPANIVKASQLGVLAKNQKEWVVGNVEGQIVPRTLKVRDVSNA